ncbi:MAG: hypothetical protein WDN25_01345 [Acetobacteraceae bacterium]
MQLVGQALAWLVACVVDGFAAYAQAMYPQFDHAEGSAPELTRADQLVSWPDEDPLPVLHGDAAWSFDDFLPPERVAVPWRWSVADADLTARGADRFPIEELMGKGSPREW